jgi:hypothetical protein
MYSKLRLRHPTLKKFWKEGAEAASLHEFAIVVRCQKSFPKCYGNANNNKFQIRTLPMLLSQTDFAKLEGNAEINELKLFL